MHKASEGKEKNFVNLIARIARMAICPPNLTYVRGKLYRSVRVMRAIMENFSKFGCLPKAIFCGFWPATNRLPKGVDKSE